MEEGAFHSVVNPQHAFKGERLQAGNRHVGKPKRRSTRIARCVVSIIRKLTNDSSRTIELIFHDYIGPCVVKFGKLFYS